MDKTTPFTIGAEVACRDGRCGSLVRVVVDPIARAVTHLVVEPEHRSGLGRLVPVDLVGTGDGADPADSGHLQLTCTTAEFSSLEEAEETQFLPGGSVVADYHEGEALSWPYYGLGMGGLGGLGDIGMGGLGMSGLGTETLGMGVGNATQPVVRDRVPTGEIEVRRGDQVHASDGAIGRVEGLVVDPRDHRITHVLLQEGHLWGRKEVAIPITAVVDVTDGIRLSISKDEVKALPAVDVDHPGAPQT
jgi:sporulation protein YlmC with PRC-barrel domain